MEVQQQHPQAADEHSFQETTRYLKCAKCSLSTHKRTNEESFQAFIRSRCIDEHYDKRRGGHTTHALWQKGKGIKCVNCAPKAICLDAEERLILTKALTKECQGNTQRSPTLLQLFGTQAQSSQATSAGGQQAATTGHETQPAPATPQPGSTS